jgi:arsenite-transporting ATPase
MNYETVVFDTAPTGHTLRLLSFPSTMETAIDKLLVLKVALIHSFTNFNRSQNRFSGLLTQMSALMGPQGAQGIEAMIEKLEQLKILISKVSKDFSLHDFLSF